METLQLRLEGTILILWKLRSDLDIKIQFRMMYGYVIPLKESYAGIAHAWQEQG